MKGISTAEGAFDGTEFRSDAERRAALGSSAKTLLSKSNFAV
jgi:hypothetical protein